MIVMEIPSKNRGKTTPLEDWLYNLELRLKIEQDWVDKTKNEIDYVKSLIEEDKNKSENGLESIEL